MNLQDLRARIRGLVDDPQGSYATDQFLDPLIRQKYEELYNALRLTGFEFDEQVVVLSSVPAGTRDLSDYATTGKPLELLLQPRLIEWKLPGVDDTQYLKAEGPLDIVRDVVADSLIDSWEYRGTTIYLTPASVALDLRIRGEFLFPPLVNDDSKIQIANNVIVVLAYEVGSLIGIVRGNPQWEKSYGDLALSAYDDLAQMLTRADSAKTRRVGRMSRRALSGNRPVAHN